MNDKHDINTQDELDDLTVIDASDKDINVVDFSLDDDDYHDDDILYDSEMDEKLPEPYTLGVRAVVFGSLSIILPVLAWIIHLMGISLIPVIIAAAAVVLAIVGFISAKKCVNAPIGTLSEGLAKTGRLVSIIGLVASSLILVYMVISIILTILTLVAIMAIYLIMGLVSVIITILGNL